ncbi:uncharacterized protein LOC114383330 [Glycine soja]|nr:uncharacterized protein LOC114383330 [Glycine soja]
MVPSSDKRPAASPSGESGQHTTTAADASSSPEFAGENINGTHSSALVEENNSTAQEPAAAKTTRASNQNLSFGEPFYGENSTPCLASDRHDQTNDKGKKVHQTIPAIVLDQSPNAELGCSDAPASGSRPSSLHLEGANTSCWSNPKNSLSSGLDLNLAPDEQGGDLQCLMSTNMNQPPQHSNTVLPFGYSDLQRGVGLLNPMGPFPMQQPNLLSAELLVPSGGRFIMEGRRMRNLDLNQPPPQEAQNEVENHNLRD